MPDCILFSGPCDGVIPGFLSSFSPQTPILLHRGEPMNRSFLLLVGFLAVGCNASPVAWWKSVNEKSQKILAAEARLEALEKEYKTLQQEYVRLESKYTDLKGKEESEKHSEKALAETGSVQGKTAAEISYKVPHGIKPEELLALAREHFREKRFGEAAICFDAFLHIPEMASIQDSELFYSTGIAWFEVGNFKKAKEHLDTARAMAVSERKEKVKKKVDLWMRVIDRRIASTGEKTEEAAMEAKVPPKQEESHKEEGDHHEGNSHH